MSIWEARLSSGCHLGGNSDSATADLRVKKSVDIYVESGCSGRLRQEDCGELEPSTHCNTRTLPPQSQFSSRISPGNFL